MSLELRKRLFAELDSHVLIDPHTHINPHAPAAATLAEILGYHYFTELAHSAGMPKAQIEQPGLEPRAKVARLIANLAPLENTIQYSWFVEIAQRLYGFEDERVTADNWPPLYDAALQHASQPGWSDEVLRQSKLEAVFLTNDFDDPLEGWDTKVYIPCLRTDDLVFHLADPKVRERLANATGRSTDDIGSLRTAIGMLFDHFVAHGARACAISLPPDFVPTRITEGRATTAWSHVCSLGSDADAADMRAVAHFVFWTLTEYCVEYHLPFDLMIGVNRAVYEKGVFQGQDLDDSRVALIQFLE